MSTPAEKAGAPALVTSGDVRVNARGRDIYAREVHDIFVTDRHAQRLMVGETFNPPGHWSSFPPHKHDGRDGEPVLEEVYYFRIAPSQGFGQQMLYTSDGESVAHVVRDGDAVLLPYGYHPVSSPPGYRLYYLWAMAGAERRMALYEDPDHRWIHEGTTVSKVMLDRQLQTVRRIEQLGVVAVIRLRDPAKLRAVVDAIAAGGVRALEMTMTVPGAVDLIRGLAPTLPKVSCLARAPSSTPRRPAPSSTPARSS